MRLPCPACAAIYEVPDRLIGAGRRLRCAKCGHDWMARPDSAVPEASPAAPAEPPPATGRPAPHRAPMLIDPPLPQLGDAPPPGGGLRLWLAWGATALAVLLLLAGFWLFRTELVAAWPPAARLYPAPGMALP